MKTSKVLLSMNPSQVRGFTFDAFPKAKGSDLASLGITLDESDVGVKFCMDSLPNMVTSPNISQLVQFFQWWMPGMIQVVTSARRADRILGRSIVGTWEDEEIVTTIKENTGKPQPYGDLTDIPLVSYNTNFAKRTNVRFEAGIQTGKLEDAKAARQRISPYNEKRQSLGNTFAIELNRIAFFGYDSYGANNLTGGLTYGILNEPNVGSATSLASNEGGTSTKFVDKTYLEICEDFTTALSALRVQSGDNFDPRTDACTCAIASSAYDSLSKQNIQGTQSVFDFLRKVYPNLEIVPVPELNGAGGAGVNDMIFMVREIGGQKVVDQLVTSTLRLLGVEPKAKGTIEGYTFSTAGSIVYMPIGVKRYTGC